MPFESLNAAPWAVNDPNGYILFPLATRANANIAAPADSDAMAILYNDGGAGHFDATVGFTHIIAWQYTDTTGNGKCYMGYQNIAEDFRTAKKNGDPGTGCMFVSDGAGRVDINAITDGGATKSGGVTGALNELTTYYLKLIMASATFTIEFYPTITDAQNGTAMVTSDTINRGGGEPSAYQFFQIMGNENKGSTGREWGFDVWDVDLQEVPPGPPTEIREQLNDSTGTAYPNGTTVYCYTTTGVLELTGSVGAVTGTDTANPSMTALVAGEVSFTFPNTDLVQRWLVVDPAVDIDGLSTNLITPVQLV